MRRLIGFLTILLCAGTIVSAQERPDIKFGKISPSDFNLTSKLIDSNTNAVVIADIGSSDFEESSRGALFSLVYKRHRRIKILNNNGFDAAAVAIPLYGNQTELVENLKAVTYNLENGVVVATKLDSKDVFDENVTSHFTRKKFTFPRIKAGSIVEYSYSIRSELFFNMQPWVFQGPYPTLWSEYETAIPDFFNFVFLSQGYVPFAVHKTEQRSRTFMLRVGSAASAGTTVPINSLIGYNKWIAKDVPALREESYTSTIANHISKLEFQLATIHFPQQPLQVIMGSWEKISEQMQASESFGQSFTRSNNWLSDEMKTVLKNAANDEEKTKKIYEFVRDNFNCIGTMGTGLSAPNSLKEIFRRKSGTVGDLNLLMLAMLRHENINAEPVLLSLRSRGVVHPVYPLMNRFNYVVCQVNLPGGMVYLDASHQHLGYNKLPVECYNGTAWVMSATPSKVAFVSDSLKESKRTSLVFINAENGMVQGSVNKIYGDHESYSLRQRLSKIKKEEFSEEIRKGVSSEMEISNIQLDSINALDEPVSLRYDIKMKAEGDVIYFNPLLAEALRKNPFTSAERYYPVEMPYTFDETVVLDMEVPKGYQVDEAPKSVRYLLNEDEGVFEYICSKSSERIQLRCRMAVNRANFSQEDYESLRQFFSFAIKKEGEQIVFKKVKA